MARRNKKFFSVKALCKRCEDVPGPRSAGFGDAQSIGDAVASARRINNRVRRERKEAKATAKDAYLAALLPR
jgi:hypothetical protein